VSAAAVEALVVLALSLAVAGYLCGYLPHRARRLWQEEQDAQFWARLRQDDRPAEWSLAGNRLTEQPPTKKE
jgi:L-alanine-DL-glutamate epimerase-like enolase superfamily enzyme